MAHDTPGTANDSQASRSAPVRFALYSVLAAVTTMAIKFGAWHLTGSVGLLSDAVESVINLIAACMALCTLVIAARPADRDHAYGHGKVEFFSSGLEGVLIVAAAVGIAWTAVDRFLHPADLNDLGLGLGAALLASAINFVTARVLMGAARRYESITLEADAHHLMTDVWTSVGLVAGLAVILAAPPSWRIIDPIVALVMAANIAFTGVNLAVRSIRGLMDAALPAEEVQKVMDAIRKTAGTGVLFHGLRTRRSGSMRFIDFHLLLPGDTTVKESHDLCCDVENEIHRTLSNCQVTIHVEPVEDYASWDSQAVGGVRGDGPGCGAVHESRED